MIEIWEECARLSDQARTMIKKGWSSDLEILEIYQQISRKHVNKTLIQKLKR